MFLPNKWLMFVNQADWYFSWFSACDHFYPTRVMPQFVLLEETVDAASLLIQKQLLMHETVSKQAHPWSKHLYVVGTNHKAGSHLLRNTMTHCFDLLGATASCIQDKTITGSQGVTSLNAQNDCKDFPAPIVFNNHISPPAILQMRSEAQQASADLRGVMIVRDPIDMVAHWWFETFYLYINHF